MLSWTSHFLTLRGSRLISRGLECSSAARAGLALQDLVVAGQAKQLRGGPAGRLGWVF